MGSGVYKPGAADMGPGQNVPPLQNGISDGGKPHVLTDLTSLAIYASDAVAIRNNLYQLARHIEQLQAALKAAGIPV